MNCSCHDEPAYWQRDTRCKAGGWWECPVDRRLRQRNLYDNDPIYRISKRLNDDARSRAKTLKRKREALHGEISPEG